MEFQEKIYRTFNMSEGLYAPVTVFEPDTGIVPLDQDEEDAIALYDGDFLVRFDYHSNAIEGSTLTIGDTATILEGAMPADADTKKLKDIYAAKGIAEAWELAKERLASGATVTEELIKDIHELVAQDCVRRARGVYRVTPAYITGAKTTPVSPELVRNLMADLMYAYKNSTLHPVARAAAFHMLFENIHPFGDGNGRTGRIILNYMLQESGYPPIAIKAEDRAKYFKGLEDWAVRDEPGGLLKLVAEGITEEIAGRKDALAHTRTAVALRDDKALHKSKITVPKNGYTSHANFDESTREARPSSRAQAGKAKSDRDTGRHL